MTKGAKTMTAKEVVEKAIETYGKEAQIDVAIEEMAELTQALLHNRRGRESNIAEELADLEIMCKQLELIFGCESETKFFLNKKLNRLMERLGLQ